MKLCIVPGSYDPMTLGHKDVIERACRLFDKVIVAIMYNDAKSSRFSYPERLEIARLTLGGLDVEICVKEGYLADFAREAGAVAYVKGIRDSKDLEYENNMERFNSERYPGCQTIYLPASEKFSAVSSTAVYEKLKNKENCEGILDDRALEYIRSLKKQYI